jgi:hypothetical protein
VSTFSLQSDDAEAAQSGNPDNGGGFVNTSPAAAGGRGPQDFGQDWLRVVASPTSPKEAAFVRAWRGPDPALIEAR